MQGNRPALCLVLFSGGLDSILACRILQEQGIRTTALRFITPFFGYDLKGREAVAEAEILEKYGIDMRVIDISEPYLAMLKRPPHGFGRYLNPCIDCKILMLRQAITMMPAFGADFLATGEVLGQRPMSQRRDAMDIIERDSGARGLLLRPLSALGLKPTRMEESGMVDRSRLLGITGRGRKEQIALASRYGINDYPAPAGGCVLADRILSCRFRKLFKHFGDIPDINSLLLAQAGRHFILPDGSWLILGRDERENQRIEDLARKKDIMLRPSGIPGPLGLLRGLKDYQSVETASRLLLRYSRARGREAAVRVICRDNGSSRILKVSSASARLTESLKLSC